MKHIKKLDEGILDRFKKDKEPKEELDFITQIDGVDFIDIKDYKSIPQDVWLTISPYVKRDCYHCAFLKAAVSLWCDNDEAIKYRGTAFPGVFKCIFWQPNEKVIKQSKKELKKLDEEV